MERYRTAFLFTLAATVLLAAALVLVWFKKDWLAAHATPVIEAVTPAATKAPPPPVSGFPAKPDVVPVTLSPERMQSIGVTTGVVAYQDVHGEIRTSGNVEVDETRLAEVQIRFSGWIQQVYADATFKQVHKGEPLLTIYSPELVTTQNEYLLAKQNRDLLEQSTVPGVASGAAMLLSSAMERLKQWQIPERELAELEETGKVKRELEIDAPVTGYIIERAALPNKYVQPGAKLYSIADLSAVWVYAQVFQNDLGRVRVGNSAEITVDSYPGRVFRGRVSFIWPQLDPATRTAKVRIEIPNPDLKLSLGMYVNIRLDLPLGRQLVIPYSGVFDTGTRQVAFVDKGEGHFEAREIEVGPRARDDVIVLKGLKAGERVVTSANFLIDSESQLQAALGSFAPPAPGVAAAAANAPQGQVILEYSSVPATLHTGTNTLRVKLTGAGGAPVTGAQVSITFFMPAMPAMGMPAMRNVVTLADKGGGVYEGPGQIQMGGTWQVTVLAAKNGQTLAQKQFSATAEGGIQ